MKLTVWYILSNLLLLINYKSSFIDVGAYSLPIIISMYWLITGTEPYVWAISLSNFLLNFKFLLFFRVFPSFGKYFVIIIGVAKEVFPFLVVLWFIIFGFAHAFFILLRSTKNNDENDSWSLTNTYNPINSDGSVNLNPTLVQTPNSNTNMFIWFPTSLLAMYLFLTGNNIFYFNYYL